MMNEEDKDKLYYRKAVVNLIRENKDKYPTINEAIVQSFQLGNLPATAHLLSETMDAAFGLNVTIGECARMLEDTCAYAKKRAEETILSMMDTGETKH